MAQDRFIQPEVIDGEVGVTIDYTPGKTTAIDLLSGAMRFIESLDKLDKALLSSVDTRLEPVAILNDVQHSSLKLMLARALKSIPDDEIKNLEWKKWIGKLLVNGKHAFLGKLNADAPEIALEIERLSADYAKAPGSFAPYHPPRLTDVMEALDLVRAARAAIPDAVLVQTELGDIFLPRIDVLSDTEDASVTDELTNAGIEIFKIKSTDMLGEAQWLVLRNQRVTRVDMLHRGFVEKYHQREIALLPGDALRCKFEETIRYDATGKEISRSIRVIEVLNIISPSVQKILPGV
jgi:hypothetical protein